MAGRGLSAVECCIAIQSWHMTPRVVPDPVFGPTARSCSPPYPRPPRSRHTPPIPPHHGAAFGGVRRGGAGGASGRWSTRATEPAGRCRWPGVRCPGVVQPTQPGGIGITVMNASAGRPKRRSYYQLKLRCPVAPRALTRRGCRRHGPPDAPRSNQKGVSARRVAAAGARSASASPAPARSCSTGRSRQKAARGPKRWRHRQRVRRARARSQSMATPEPGERAPRLCSRA